MLSFVYTLFIILIMRTKERVYQVLSSRNGEFVSGESLASKIGVSRAAIWKAVNALIEEGYNVEGVTRKGYRLLFSDVFSSRSLEALLDIPFYFYEEIDSTNSEAKRLLSSGHKAPFAVIAARQSGGRGRRGRSFVSAEGGVYFSLVLKNEGAMKVEKVTTQAAIGISRAIDSLGFSSSIKWVNDIYVDGRKCVGILTEGVVNLEENMISEVVIGIGTNYTTSEFPAELKDIVTSLYPDGNPPLSRSAFLALEIKEVMKALMEESYIDEYRSKCLVLSKEINVIKNDVIRPAFALDLDDEAHLIVRYEDGSVEHLSSGDVSIRAVKAR